MYQPEFKSLARLSTIRGYEHIAAACGEPDTRRNGLLDLSLRKSGMNINTRNVDGVNVFDIDGKLDTQTATPALEVLLEHLASKPKRVLVSLAPLEYISSSGLRVILRVAKEVRGYGGAIRVCEAQGVVKEVLEISGFDSLLDLYGDEAQAMTSF
jgi:anti-anti-sigma factor